MASEQIRTGDFKQAHENLANYISTMDNFGLPKTDISIGRVITHLHLSVLLAYSKEFSNSQSLLSSIIETLEKKTATSGFPYSIQGVPRDINLWLCKAWRNQAIKDSLLVRTEVSNPNAREHCLRSANQSVKYVERAKQNNYSFIQDRLETFWVLGMAYRLNHMDIDSEKSLTETLILSRDINFVRIEPKILLELAKTKLQQKDKLDARRFCYDALSISERCDYLVDIVDANLLLADIEVRSNNSKQARKYAEDAKKLATCDGPPYYYKVAYEEAERFLEQLAG